jgi:hypothetical protein
VAVKPEDVHMVIGTDEWSALYVEGVLTSVGDHYVVQEALLDILEISSEQSNDFMMGGNFRKDVANTVDEMLAYRRQREEREQRAADLRTRAQQLMREAAELLGEKSEV